MPVLFLITFLTVACLSAEENTGAQIPFSQNRMIIEFNSTDEDIGVQIFLDAEGWKNVRIVGPDGQEIFEVFARGKLRKQGMTELFFESEEPSLDELPLSEFLARFPEGEYKFFGSTTEGERLIGSAIFTHNIPEGPAILAPQEDSEVDPKNVVVRWEPVTTPAGIVIAGYQVIVEGDNPLRSFTVDLPANATKVKVPSAFLRAGTDYKVEVLAKEAGGNQTISELEFSTE